MRILVPLGSMLLVLLVALAFRARGGQPDSLLGSLRTFKHSYRLRSVSGTWFDSQGNGIPCNQWLIYTFDRNDPQLLRTIRDRRVEKSETFRMAFETRSSKGDQTGS